MPALAQPPISPKQKHNQTPPVKFIFINCSQIQYIASPVFLNEVLKLIETFDWVDILNLNLLVLSLCFVYCINDIPHINLF